MKFIPILRTGRHKDASGRVFDITPQMLKEIAETNKPKQAPLVKGHPSAEAPAMGWIDKLKVVGNELQASFSEVTEEFKGEVERSSFRNISASFFHPFSEANPHQGKYSLRHVGALGASRPAIPNLGTLQEALEFADTDVSTQNCTGMYPAFCVPTEDDVTCYSEFAEQGENIGFFEKLIKGAIEKALKKQREEIMADVKKIVGNVNFNEEDPQQTNQENGGTEDMADQKTAREIELEEKLKKAEDERDRLKTEQDKGERSKVIADEVAKVKDEKNLDDATAQKLQDKAESMSDKGVDPKEAVVNLSEFLPSVTVRTHHRFGNKPREDGKGISDFAEGEQTPIEHTAEYADEVDKLVKEGMSRNSAGIQAKTNLSK